MLTRNPLRQGELTRVAIPRGEIVRGREVVQIATLAPGENFAQLDQAIDGRIETRQELLVTDISWMESTSGTHEL